ncbi:MAG: ABC transporter substrate-binding protein, partial [Gaiellaceae bacterium]
MRSNSKVFRPLGMLALVAALALVAGGCGGSGKKSSSGGSTGSSGKTYPLLRLAFDAPDYMDPGLYYTVAAYQVDNYVWTGLMGYKHQPGAAGAELVPYLAESMPTISADGMNLKFKLRANLKYSNGAEVKASDFKYTIERDFKIDSPGVGFFSAIKGVSGANGFAETKKGHISGIITDDAARTIEIQLDHPEGDILYILALEFAHFVPAGTPASDQSTHPIPSTGPYMLQSYTPNRSFTLVRNPNYNNQIPTMPSGAPDKVVGNIITDPVASYQQVVSGKAYYDYNQVPNDRLPEAQSKYKDQLRIYTNANTWYYFLNNKIPPFNNIKARQAVNYAIDRQAIVSGPFGGLGRPTEN